MAMMKVKESATKENLIYKDEVYAIVGAALEVHNQLDCGFLEPVYQEALSIELAGRKIPFVTQVDLEIGYKGQTLHKLYKADFVAFNKIIIEIKAIDKLTPVDEAQIQNYLKATGFQLGLLINFGASSLEWRRRILSNHPKEKFA